MGNLIIESGLVTASGASVVADLLIEEGRIAAVARPASLRRNRLAHGVDDSLVVDALGKFILPAATVLECPQSPDTVKPSSSSVGCWLRATGSPPPSGNWLSVWYPSLRAVGINQLESTLADQVWGGGVPVVGVAARNRCGEEEEMWLTALVRLAAAADVMVVLWWDAASTRRQVQRVAARVAASGARLLLGLEDASQADSACSLAAALAKQAPAGVWVASPPPAAGDDAAWWELVRVGAIRCLTTGVADSHLIARLYRQGVASGRIGLIHLTRLVAGWLRRHLGLSPPLTVDSCADLVVLDPECERLADAEHVWINGVPLCAAAGRRERGRPLPWPH